MMKKTWITLIIALTIVFIFLAIRLLSGEDNWICDSGEWIKHGNPSSNMPTASCPK